MVVRRRGGKPPSFAKTIAGTGRLLVVAVGGLRDPAIVGGNWAPRSGDSRWEGPEIQRYSSRWEGSEIRRYSSRKAPSFAKIRNWKGSEIRR